MPYLSRRRAEDLARPVSSPASGGASRSRVVQARRQLQPDDNSYAAASQRLSPRLQRYEAAVPVIQPAPYQISTGIKTSALTNEFGVFEIKHGLLYAPGSKEGSKYGRYFMRISMTPNAATGNSAIGFVQVARQGTPASYATEAGSPGMNSAKARKTDPETGWRVDRIKEKRDKTPFFSHSKKSGRLVSHPSQQLGKHKVQDVVLRDRPHVADIDHMEFVATAMDINSGREFGAISWGFKHVLGNFQEETPRLETKDSTRIEGRDAAFDKWNKDIAGRNGIDKVVGH